MANCNAPFIRDYMLQKPFCVDHLELGIHDQRQPIITGG